MIRMRAVESAVDDVSSRVLNVEVLALILALGVLLVIIHSRY